LKDGKINREDAAYTSRYEAMFLCLHLEGPKMLYEAAAKYMKKLKTFVSKWMKRYSVKNDDLPVSSAVQKMTKK